jgi:hypothetical protein
MMRGRELSRLQGILRLKFSYVRCRKGETFTTQESGMNAEKIWGWEAVLGNDAFTDGIEHDLGRIVQVQFLQNVPTVSLNSVRTDVECR